MSGDPRIKEPSYESAIAIVGMSGRFPGARNLDEFWANLVGGKETIKFFTDEELAASGVPVEVRNDPRYVKARGVLDGVDQFDAGFFGFNPREAEMLDPQHRLFLEVAWEALETAGYDPGRYPGAIGLFAAAGMNAYFMNNLLRQDALADPITAYNAMIGNDKDFLCTRVSYKLNLRGPSVSVQTACSSSLVAIHLAVQSLLSGESDMALAGGVSIQVPHNVGYVATEGMILSPDGHCRPFDAGAEGTVPGNGAGVVLLKRLTDAIADGDRIRALIRGSAINNDGSLKVGYTAPSMEGQAQVIAEALAVGEVNPASVTYVETHGTGTELGDPIEIGALTQVFRSHTQAKGYCAIASLKSNMGHLDTAAGVSGVIKAVLALENRKIPPSLHYERPNPQIDFAASPFYVNAAVRDWIPNGGPLRAAASSFGIGGTNAHVVLEAAPREMDEPVRDERPQVLVLSARSAAALTTTTASLVAHLEAHPNLPLEDVAHTLQSGRAVFGHRRAVICTSREEALGALKGDDPKHTWSVHEERTGRPVGFLFPGQGAQHAGMAKGLYDSEPVFRAEVDACAAKLEPHLGLDLRTLMFPAVGGEDEANRRLAETAITQPAVFVIEYALAKLWRHWGVEPDAMIGHSIGEYVAACLADVFTLDDALALIAKRGKLIQSLPPGRMIAVPLAEEKLRPMLRDGLAVAAVNAPTLCTVSGPAEAIERFEATLAELGIEGRPLHTSHAFHSSMMDPIVDAFAAEVKSIGPRAPRRRYISNVTGTWIRKDEAIDPAYYGRHLRQGVRFADGMAELMKEPDRVFIEVGPGQTMAALARLQPGGANVVATLPHPRDGQPDLAHARAAAGRLWLVGGTIEWSGLHRDGRRRVVLPTYPFERQRFWIDPGDGVQKVPALEKRRDVTDWLYVPSWRRSLRSRLANGKVESDGTWLIMGEDGPFAKGIAHGLRQVGIDVVRAATAGSFSKRDDGAYGFNPARAEDYDAVVRAVRGLGKTLVRIVHLLSTTGPGDAIGAARLERARTHGFQSVIRLAQALGRGEASKLDLDVVTAGAHEVTGSEELYPEAAAVFGPCQVIPQEYPQIRCREIDLELGRDATADLVAELAQPRDDARRVALRGGQRWIHGYEPTRLPRVASDACIERRGVYLLTGGPDGLSYEIARYLAENATARLVFIDPVALPTRGDWTSWLSNHAADDPTSRRIFNVQWLESHGGQVAVYHADLGDPVAVGAAVDRAIKELGGLNGVFHSVAFGGESVATAVQQAEPADADAIFRDKGLALYALERALAGKKVDFVSIQSSLATVLGGVGFVTYAGINHFLDAFAHAHNRKGEGPTWTALDWNNWRFSGDASEAGADSFLMGKIGQLAITPEEGLDVLRRSIKSGASQLIVSTATLESRFAEAAEQARRAAAGDVADDSRHERPEVPTEYAAPTSAAEQVIAEIWQDILGIDRIGVDDNFFELGGHSLLAIQLVSRLRQAFDVSLSLRALFEAPTVSGLATLVAGEAPKSEDLAAMEALLKEVEGLSDEEIQRTLAAGEGAAEGGQK